MPAIVSTTVSKAFYNCTKPYTCNFGHPNGKHGWTIKKHSWCCKHEKVGCESASVHTGNVTKYDCKENLWNYTKDWSDDKKSWCCEHELIWCPLKNENDWSTEQKQWCCDHEQRGCLDNHQFPPQQTRKYL